MKINILKENKRENTSDIEKCPETKGIYDRTKKIITTSLPVVLPNEILKSDPMCSVRESFRAVFS